MNCRITQESCIIKPSGFEEKCFSTCPKAKDFLRMYNLSHIGPTDVAWYLDELLYDLKTKDKNDSLQFNLREVIKYIKR